MPTPQHVGTLADRPAPTAETRNRLYYASDGGASSIGGLYQSNGAAWILLLSAPAVITELPVPVLADAGKVLTVNGSGTGYVLA